jgi:starch synthase (maltosyl-transferring)
MNAIRRAHPALQEHANITFLETENDALVAYAKRTGADVVITVVSLDPAADQEGVCIVSSELGLPPSFPVRDELISSHPPSRFHWRLGRNYVRLGPGQAHVLGVEH